LPLFTALEGGYVLGRVIDSSGSFGMVYTAIHQDFPNTPLAIKEYYPMQLAERVGQTIKPNPSRVKVYQDYLQRFEQEAQLLFKCQRYPFVPGIVRGSDLIHKNDTAYLVMERLFGLTLEQLIKKHEKLTLEQIVGWLKPLLENLTALHQRNIFHRDLKPANIFLQDAPKSLLQPVIMDFGIAREGELKPFDSTNIIGANGGGTFCYRPPEMIERLLGYSIAAHTDIYSIGAILFHCLYGKPPQDFLFVNKEESIPLHEFDKSLITEPKLHAVILECLKQNPKDRPKNAKVLLEKLAFLWQRYETIVPINAEVKKANDRVAELETAQTKLAIDNKQLQQKVDQLGGYWQKRLQESEAKLAHLSIDKENLQQQLSFERTARPAKPIKRNGFLTGLIALLIGIGLGFAANQFILDNLAKTDLSANQGMADAQKSLTNLQQRKTAISDWQTIDRYQVKGGLVKDTVTGLMWMRCSLGQEWDGSTCQGKAVEYKWNDAMKQPNNFSYAGFNDWRVPTIQELRSLVYCGSGQPKTWFSDVDPKDDGCKGDYAKPTIKSDVFLNTLSNWFWSSSPVAGNSSVAWIVNFDSGDDDWDIKGSYDYVRLVRSGQ
jgi:serine/threonine protein kinase